LQVFDVFNFPAVLQVFVASGITNLLLINNCESRSAKLNEIVVPDKFLTDIVIIEEVGVFADTDGNVIVSTEVILVWIFASNIKFAKSFAIT
jgi:hypothetical protein